MYALQTLQLFLHTLYIGTQGVKWFLSAKVSFKGVCQRKKAIAVGSNTTSIIVRIFYLLSFHL